MSADAFAWAFLTGAFIIVIGVCAVIGAIIESYLERRSEREQRLPNPEWRARVRELHKFSRWWS